MFRIRHTLIALALLVTGSVFAQDDADLLRYSMLNPVGTARFNAMGGAFGALGANFTALGTNPAGIGFYTRHELSFTLGTVTQSSTSDYYKESNSFDKTRIHVPQGGGVFLVKDGHKSQGNAWSLQVGFGANRVKDFNKNVYTKGVNTESSYMDAVAASSAGYNLGDESASVGYLAFQTGLLNEDTLNHHNYYSAIGEGLEQKHILQEWGNITEMVFSFGGNYADKFFFGVTLGVPIVNYNQKSVIEEVNTEGMPSPIGFQSYRLNNRMDVSGSGINLKLGVIYKPVPFFRVGLAFHTPTAYSLKEKLYMNLSTERSNIIEDDYVLPKQYSVSYNDYRYGLSTPLKGILSTAFLIKNFGAIAIEGEIIDYRQMSLNVDDDVDYNQAIKKIVRNNYRLSGVLRAGTEWRVGIVSLRAGYIWQSCPYKNKVLKDRWSDHTVTAGLGLNIGRWTLDFGFMANVGKRIDDFYYLIDQDGAPLVSPAKLNLSKYTCTLTLGCRF